MDVTSDTPPPPPSADPSSSLAVAESEDDSGPLAEKLALATDPSSSLPDRVRLLEEIVKEGDLWSVWCVRVKESAVYALARAICKTKKYDDVLPFLTTTCSTFFDNVTKAKTAKAVRRVLDIVEEEAPEEFSIMEGLCTAVISWCTEHNRTFLKQRVVAKLSSVLYLQNKFSEALELIVPLIAGLKKLDDKALLVEAHLVEAKVHHGLRNLPKAKAALTSSRTAANAIYVQPSLQSEIDSMSGVLHTEERDYNTAHSYFLEAFEQLDQMGSTKAASSALKYMMLCKVLDALGKGTRAKAELSGLVTGKQGVKYAGRSVDAMQAVAAAAGDRDLSKFDKAREEYGDELKEDLLVSHHLGVLYESLLESNLLRIIEPFSRVEISRVAHLISMDRPAVEKKLSQMILDGTLLGILDQGNGHLIVHEEERKDGVMEKGLKVVEAMGKVVDNLYGRSQRELVMR